jgi:hypothetical protein
MSCSFKNQHEPRRTRRAGTATASHHTDRIFGTDRQRPRHSAAGATAASSRSTSSGGRGRGEISTFRDGPPAAVRTALRVVRATHDQLRVEWSAEADPLSWQVVCWDGRDAAVARLKLGGMHRRATFAGLARLQQPFTIAVSGLADDGSVV